jgi:hypothetical protein
MPDDLSPLPSDVGSASELQRKTEEELVKEATVQIIERIRTLSPEEAHQFCFNSGLYNSLSKVAEEDPRKFFNSLGITRENLVEMLDKLPLESPRTSASQPIALAQESKKTEKITYHP